MMNTTPPLKTLFAALLGAATLCATAQAAVLYSFSTTQGSPNPGFDTGDITITSAANVLGPAAAGLDDNVSGLVDIGGGVFVNNGSSRVAFSLGNAANNITPTFDDGYMQWTVSAAPGYLLNLDSLTFRAGKSGTAGTSNRQFAVFGEVNSGAFSESSELLHVLSADLPTYTSNVAGNYFDINLSGAGFQGVESITFRFNPLINSTDTYTVDFNNMSLNGTVSVIPEPSTLALLGLTGLAAFVGLRRRRS